MSAFGGKADMTIDAEQTAALACKNDQRYLLYFVSTFVMPMGGDDAEGINETVAQTQTVSSNVRL